ncbi:MAG: DUF5320 domain-containing protein [Anaerolineaceae bacterium]|jgi:hypothetical protein|nr:DUF5320 domain-containing protein [Anaerolineaceae bacterium]
MKKPPELGGTMINYKKEAIMPGGDKTGPQGDGPLTGRQAGYCSGDDQPGYGRPGFGRRAFGFGRQRRRGFWPAQDQDAGERSSLLQEVRDLKEMVSGLQKKVDKFEK